MDWLERLNRAPAHIDLGAGTVEILYWAYDPYLNDNMPHRHTFFEVCLVGRYGQGRFIVQGKEHALAPGDLFIARPGVLHQIVNTAPVRMELYWVSFQWAPDVPRHTDEIDILMKAFSESETPVTQDEGGRISGLWSVLKAISGGAARPGYSLQAHGVISSLLLAIAQTGVAKPLPALESLEPGVSDVTARVAVRYIHDNLRCPLTLAEISNYVHVSPRHLSRLFAQFTGASPVAYIARARMDRARGLLTHGGLSIKEIAVAVGYPDVHHFTRVFTRHYGCPPGEYRRRKAWESVRDLHSPGALV